MRNVNDSDNDFVIRKRMEGCNGCICSDADTKLILNVLDTKFKNKESSSEINRLFSDYLNNKISKCYLNEKLYCINHKKENPILKRKPEEFFINIDGYGKNYEWANYMADSAGFASLRIKDGGKFQKVYEQIAEDLSDFELNHIKTENDFEKAKSTGILRTVSNLGDCVTSFSPDESKYKSYAVKFQTLAKNKSKFKINKKALSFAPKIPKKYRDFVPTEIIYCQDIQFSALFHSNKGIAASLDYCNEIYNELCEKYLNKNLTKENIKEINEKIAEIHWLLSHSMPFLRGSDAINNTFIKSLYAALGFETFPPKQGISFDLEAFSRELKDYIKIYPKLYQKEPQFVVE